MRGLLDTGYTHRMLPMSARISIYPRLPLAVPWLEQLPAEFSRCPGSRLLVLRFRTDSGLCRDNECSYVRLATSGGWSAAFWQLIIRPSSPYYLSKWCSELVVVYSLPITCGLTPHTIPCLSNTTTSRPNAMRHNIIKIEFTRKIYLSSALDLCV